jgi:DNA polymerase-3 subunit gamma/tau
MVRGQLAAELGGDPGDLSERTRAALTERRGRLSSGDLLRMLSALGELEPRFRRSTQQQLLLETALVRFALLDRTVAIEDVLKGIGGESGSSPGGGGGRPQPPAPARSGMSATPPRKAETPANVERVTELPASTVRSSTPAPAMATAGVAVEPLRAASAGRRGAPSAGSAVAASDLNAVAGIWDDMVAGIRRDRPFIATLLEQALPVSTNANGVLVLQVEAPAVQEGLAAKTSEIVSTMSRWLAGLQKLNVRLAGDSVSAGPAPRMTVETVRSETLAALRKRDPVLNAAIDALDLDLVN